MSETRRVTHPHSDEIRTQQSQKGVANINSIIARWRDGVPLPEAHRDPQYGDFSNTEGYHAALDSVKAAEVEFMRLPSAVRADVDNDVGQFLTKCADPDGLKELIELGLEGAQAPPGVEMPREGVRAEPEPEEEAPTG